MGPVWDWEAAFGNTFFVRGEKTHGWRFEGAADPDYTWYQRLFEDPDFLQRYIDRWAALRTTAFATSNVLAVVDHIAAQVRERQARDAWRWRELWSFERRSRAKTYVEEVNQLKQWIAARLAWIDSQGYPAPVSQITGGTPQHLRMTAQDRRTFYTLDGSDPRLPGGGVSPRAMEYLSPIALTPNLFVTARIRSDYGLWSAPTVVRR
jgi:hypothetical protein